MARKEFLRNLNKSLEKRSRCWKHRVEGVLTEKKKQVGLAQIRPHDQGQEVFLGKYGGMEVMYAKVLYGQRCNLGALLGLNKGSVMDWRGRQRFQNDGLAAATFLFRVYSVTSFQLIETAWLEKQMMLGRILKSVLVYFMALDLQHVGSLVSRWLAPRL